MNPQPLFTAKMRETGAFACGNCFAVSDLKWASSCCTCYVCGGPLGADGMGHGKAHRECSAAQVEKFEADALEAAEEVEAASHEGMVVVFGRDTYYESLDDLMEGEEYQADGEDPRPIWAQPCTTEPFPGLDIDNLISTVLEGMYEGADYSDLSGLDALGAAVKAFNEANKEMVSYIPHPGKKIRIPWPKEEVTE